MSTLPGGQYGFMSGTSQATAFASGLAALILGKESKIVPPEELIARIEKSGTFEEQLKDKIRSASIISVDRSLHMQGQFAHNIHQRELSKKRWSKLLNKLESRKVPVPTVDLMEIAKGPMESLQRAPSARRKDNKK